MSLVDIIAQTGYGGHCWEQQLGIRLLHLMAGRGKFLTIGRDINVPDGWEIGVCRPKSYIGGGNITCSYAAWSNVVLPLVGLCFASAIRLVGGAYSSAELIRAARDGDLSGPFRQPVKKKPTEPRGPILQSLQLQARRLRSCRIVPNQGGRCPCWL